MRSTISFRYVMFLLPLLLLFLLFGILTADPGTDRWNLPDSDGATTQRSLISFDDRQTWLTIGDADALVRAGGEYVAGDVVINEVLFFPDTTDTAHYRNHEWAELFNPGDTVDIGGWVVSNRDASLDAVLPAWDFPETTYLVVHFTAGTNDSDFSDGEGDYYVGNADVFSDSMDECALYTGTPGPSTIIDFLSWLGGDTVFTGGLAHDYAFSAGIWDLGDYFTTLNVTTVDLTDPVEPGESIGRDSSSTDTDQPEDWDTEGGPDAIDITPGAVNCHDLTIGPGPQPQPRPPRTWTIMVYMDGDGNLERYWLRDIARKMQAAGSDSNVNIVVQYFTSGHAAYRFYIERHFGSGISSPRVQVFGPGGGNPGDPTQLEDFVTWGMTDYPADYYVLFICGHGDGWKGILFDRNEDRLTMPDLKAALDPVPNDIDVLVFYSCLMGMAEVGGQLWTNVDYMVASEEVTLTAFPFHTVLTALKDNVATWDGADFAVYSVDQFDQALSRYWRKRTTSAIDLFELRFTLLPLISSLGNELRIGVDDYRSHDDPNDNVQMKIKGDLDNTERFWDKNFIDLYHFAQNIKQDAGIPETYKTQAQPTMDAMEVGAGVILQEKHGPSHPNAHGLSIYFPRRQTKYLGDKYDCPFDSPFEGGYAPPPVNKYAFDPDDCKPPDVDCEDHFEEAKNHPIPPTPDFLFVQDTEWDEFLHRYYEPVADAGEDQVAFVGAPVNFNGSGSSDADGSVTHWYWDFNSAVDDPPPLDCVNDDWDKDCEDGTSDDNQGDEEEISHTFLEPGVYEVNLTVWDDHHLQPGLRDDPHSEHYETHRDKTIVVVEDPSLVECIVWHDNGSASSYFGSWSVGDQQAIYYDPAVECVDCLPYVYPFRLTEIEGAFYDFAGIGHVDVVFHIYEAGDPCDGPGTEIYSFATTITEFYGDMATIPVPDLLCLEDDFFLAVEYMSGSTGEIPCLLMTDETDVADTCIQWNEYQDFGWIEWYDFWSPPPPGWLMLRAGGCCADEACDLGEECDLQQDSGVVAYYFGSFAEGDIIAKYFDPVEYCEPPVYPYRIHDVDFLLYDFGGMGSVDIIVNVDLECQDPCDGPGAEIYREPFTITTFYGDMAHVVLSDVVCVYEPFFITIEYASGVQGSTPSLLWGPEDYPCDTCHAWLWWESGGYPFWTEWHDFWSPPAGGCPIIRVSGYTESPACDISPCDTTLETLPGSPAVAYFFKEPPNDRYINMRFEMPADHGGRLEGFEVGWYDYTPNPSYGTPDPDMYVWLSDGTFPLDNNPPFQAIAEFHKDFTEIVWFPGATYFDAYPFNLIFDPGELFHIGGTHAHDAGDTLAWLGVDVSPPGGRASAWDGSAWGSYDPYEFRIDAIICPFAPDQPTFSMRCTPSVGYATPDDPPVDVFQIQVGAVIGYAENVTLSLLDPGVDITATFSPNGVPPDFVSDVAIMVWYEVPYGSYTLTFQGTGDDQQTKTCDVTLITQPPYDEGHVNFFHGFQRVSNFGAIGNDDTGDNFEWYGGDPLYDGSIITVIPVEPFEAHMALDVYDCDHVGFTPTQHMIITDIAGCGRTKYEELYGEMSYSEFYTAEGEWDSLFVIGLRDVECTDFSIKIKIYYNPNGPDIPEMYAGIFEDWDVLGDDWGEMDTVHNLMYQYDPADPSIVFGIMSVPFYDQFTHNMTFIHNPTEVYPTGDSSFNCGNDPGPAYLARLMMKRQYRDMGYWTPDPDDHSVLTVSPPFSLNQGEMHIEIWIDFGRNMNDGMTWEQWYKRILRYVGMYRGDVNASDTLDLPSLDVSDLVYLINYLYKGGPAPLPFADQGNVDGKGPYGGPIDTVCPKNNVDVQDLVYLLNFIYDGGPPPVDYVRYIEQFWSRPSLFLNPYWN